MPEYLSPGVYIEELSTGPRPIEGVSTSTAGFLGITERGPEYPFLVGSWLEFQRWFGTYLPETLSYLPHAVQGFFDNGGQRLFVARITGANAAFTRRTVGNLVMSSIGRGAWGNRIFLRIEPGSNRGATNPDLFKLTLLYYSTPPPDPLVDPLSNDPADRRNPNRREPDFIEQFDDLVHTPGTSNNVETVLNSASHLVRVWFNPLPPAPVPLDPAAFAPLGADGVDGDPVAPADFTGDLDPVDPATPRTIELLGRGRGFAAMEAVDAIALLAVPDEVRYDPATLTQEVIRQCERLKDRFGIVSTVAGRSNANDVRPPEDTTYAAFYYPWIEIYNQQTQRTLRLPPTGHVTGLIARTDIERGVHKAPANEVVRDATDLEFPVTKTMQDLLNPRGVNCIRDFRNDGRGIRLWGARTMTSDPMWKYVNVRRLFIFIEESIDEGTQWVVFEPNDEPLWAQVRRSISNFLIRVWKSGALMGLTQEEAFFVKCDRTTMTQDDIENGRLVCYIGIAPVRPAEFVIFRISQKTAEAPA
jgi:phage tail sheath protein FI